MKHRFIAAAMATSLSLLTVSAVYAQPRDGRASVSDQAPKQKSISFHLRNDTKTPLTIKAGDQELTVQPGQTTALKLPNGQQVVEVTATDTIAAGAVLAMVSPILNGATVAVR